MQCTASKFLACSVSMAGIVSYHTGNELALGTAKMLLSQFKGGCINLSKNDTTGIATICLNRPEKKNAISGQMLLDLETATLELGKWENGKGVILYGANNIFSSGGDLAMSKETATEDQGLVISKFAQELTTRFRTLPLVSVALIEGVALGGGAEIAVAACDWRLMAEDAHIGFVHGRMGLSPGWGGGIALKKLIGSSKALELTVSGKLVKASEAVSMGLANEIIYNKNNDSLDQAHQWLQHMIENISVEVLRANKILMTSKEYQQELELEQRLHATLWGGKRKLEALAKNIKHK